MLVFASTHWKKFLGITCVSVSLCFVSSVKAQITPDSTLPNNSSVRPEGNRTLIEGGTTAGNNLFHSFKEFSVPTGAQAHFNNAVNINNILTRVTGGSISNIDGLIKASGTANLFLINPGGIVFGENAQLDIGGSFVGSTADAIGFDENNFFSALDPQNNSSLLQINPNALFFNQIKPASIENNSVVDVGLNPSDEYPGRGLRVPDGKSLLLVGGDVNMDGGGKVALGGRVELGGLATTGTVGLNVDGNNFSLNFPSEVEKSDVAIGNSAGVRVIADDGGSIAINARNLEITDESFLFAGIETGLGTEQSRAGNIDINATNAIVLKNDSKIANQILAEARGQGGDISISASRLLLESGAQVSTTIFGAGKGGRLTVDAQDVELIGASENGRSSSGFFAAAGRNSTGDAGDLAIKTNTLIIKDGAQMSLGTLGAGNAGKLIIDAKNVELIGISKDGRFASALSTSAGRNSTGDAGDLAIKTNTFIIKDGAQVGAVIFGEGSGGDLTVDAQDVQVIGESEDGLVASSLAVTSQTSSTGDTGNLNIKTNTLLVQDGGIVSASTFGTGKGGRLTIEAQDVQVIGESKDGFVSGLFANELSSPTLDVGDLTITTNTLLVRDGAQVGAGTFGESKGANLTINASDVQLIGTSKDSRSSSGLFSSAQPGSTGDAGNLTIKTNTLLLRDGAQVSASTFGAGTGGKLTVEAQDVQLIGTAQNGTSSGLITIAEQNSTGNAGDLNINASTLEVENGAEVSVQGFTKEGSAGILTINADSIRLNNNALLTADTRSNKVAPEEQATININSQDLIMRRGSNIFTNAQGENVQGGNINIDTDILAALENSDISANSLNFRGGNVLIETQGIFGTQFRLKETNESDITATGAEDIENSSGIVEINTPDIDLNTGLVNLPSIPVETEVAQACADGSSIAQSRFEIIGRGGLPHLPTDALSSDAVQVDLVSIKPEVNKPLKMFLKNLKPLHQGKL